MTSTSPTRRDARPKTKDSPKEVQPTKTPEDHTEWTLAWWAFLCVVSSVNIKLFELYGKNDVLCGTYVVVCAFRSAVPRIDLERTCLWDSFLSSMALGRACATVAELCFAAQTAALLSDIGVASGSAWMITAAQAIVPAIAVAQTCCWCGVITTNNIFHAVEESIWGVVYGLLGASCAFVLVVKQVSPDLHEGLYPYALGAALMCPLYVAFMFIVDVPMYYRRWLDVDGSTHMGLSEGLTDAIFRRIPTKSWTVWQPEVAWLTGYFSGAVWISIALAARA